MRRGLLLIFAIFITIHTYAQQSIKEGIDTIKERYDAKFIYDASLKTGKLYVGTLKGKSLQSDLSQLFAKSDIVWSLKDGYVLLKALQKYNISGIIKDAESGETLIGATIIEHDRQNATYSNNQGFFGLKTGAGARSFTCRYIGYEAKTITIDVKSDSLVLINMTPTPFYTGEVVVTSDNSESKNMRIGRVDRHGAISVNVKEMEYMPSFGGGQDIFKYLQIVPGVSSGNDGSSNLYIRGGMADQTQILLDDVPIYNQSHAFGYTSIFSAEAVKSVELHKGYTSPYYGGRLSGVVDMRMRDGNRYEHKQSIQLGLTTFSANAEGPISKGRGSYLFSGRIFSLYPFLKLGYTFIPKHLKSGAPLFSFFDITGKLTYDLNDKNKLSLSSYSGSDSFGVENYSTSVVDLDSDLPQDETKITSESESSMRWGSSVASLRLSSILNNRLFMNNIVYYSYLGNKVTSNYDDKISGRSYNADISARMDEIGYKSTFDYRLSSIYSMDFGTHISHQNFAPQKMTSQIDGGVLKVGNFSTKTLTTYAAYLNNNIKIDRLDIDLGARAVTYDNGSKTEFAIEPRISTSYSFNDKLSLWGAYTRNNQPLFSLNKYYLSVPIDYWAPFKDNELQTSTQYTIGVRHGASSAFTVTSELYYKKTRNLTMVYDSDEFLLEGEGYERGKGDAYGAELMMQYSKRRFSIVGSYAYSKSDITIDGNRQPFIFDTPHAANILTMYKVVNSEEKKHVLSVNVAYKSGRPYPLSNELYDSVNGISVGNDIIHYSKFSTIRLKDYFRADISFSMEKKLRRGSRIWQVSITNFTNYKNPYIILADRYSGNSENGQNQFKAFTIVPLFPSFSYTRKF